MIQISGIDPPDRECALVFTGGEWSVGMEVETTGRRVWRVTEVRLLPNNHAAVRMVERTVNDLRWVPIPLHLLQPRKTAANQPKLDAAARAEHLRSLRKRRGGY